MDAALRARIRAACKAWWTPERRAEAAARTRRAWRKRRLYPLINAAIGEQRRLQWPCCDLWEHELELRRKAAAESDEWNRTHDDSGDWEFARDHHGRVRLMRTKLYGKPIKEEHG